MPLTDKLEQRMSTIQSNLKSPTHKPFGSKPDLEKCTSVTFDVLWRILVSVLSKFPRPLRRLLLSKALKNFKIKMTIKFHILTEGNKTVTADGC